MTWPRPLLSAVIALPLGATAHAGDWPQWRGPSRDGHSTETGLLEAWPDDGPPVAWKVNNVGVGYSSVSVASGRVFTMGDLDGIEHILCLDERDGSVIWAVQPEPVARALEERVDTRFARADKNGDGELNELEAMSALGGRYAEADAVGDGAPETVAEERTRWLFGRLDRDSSGALAYSEVPGALQRDFARIDRPDSDADAQALAERRTKTLLEEADQDGDKRLSRRESRKTPLRRRFRSIDKKDPQTGDGDEQLTAGEIRQYFLTREKGKDGQLTPKELQEFFQREYPGRDGVLVKEDLYRHYGGFRNNRGDGPRATPTIEGNRLYAEGGTGDVSCLDVETGKTIWHVNLVDDLGGRRPGWGYSESPLIDGERLIVGPGGQKGTVAALNKHTGEVVWRSTGVPDRAHYASPIIAEVDGVRQIVKFTRKRVVGLNAGTGELLWDYSNSANGTANCATPIYHDNRVFTSSAYGTGGGLVELTRTNGRFEADEVYFEDRMANHHGGIILHEGYLYGFGSGGLICMNFETGKIAWRNRSVGKGSLCYADGHFYCFSERQTVGLVEANPREYVEKGRFKLPDSGWPSWAHPVVANGRLYIRDQEHLTAFDVRASDDALSP